MAKIVLAVSSSVAVYKSLELVSLLKKDGHEVRSILSENAKKLISPRLFHALSGYDEYPLSAMPHIDLARGAELMVFFPTTANRLAKAAHGIADDLIGSTFLALNAPSIFYCAMNPSMWQHVATQKNVERLRDLGFQIEAPIEGEVACGDFGAGKLQDVVKAKADIDNILKKTKSLLGKKILITSGGATEFIDPVRVLSNLSSGKMGAALAEECLHRGAEVFYLHHVNAKKPKMIGPLHFTAYVSTKELLTETKRLFPSVDVLIMAAAPCDYAPIETQSSKIKSSHDFLELKLKKNPDILASLEKKGGQIVIGFAAETDSLRENALKKLKKKRLDFIVANKVSSDKNSNVGISGDLTDIMIISSNEKIIFEKILSKIEASRVIIDLVEKN